MQLEEYSSAGEAFAFGRPDEYIFDNLTSKFDWPARQLGDV
jgi:hypothetical protein